MMVLFILSLLYMYVCILTILCNDTIATVKIGILPIPLSFIRILIRPSF